MQNRPPSGRLIACDPELNQATVRADKLAWPLGVVVSPDGAEVWVAEAWAHRLAAYPRGARKSVSSAKNYSGYPARLAGGDAGHVGWPSSACGRS